MKCGRCGAELAGPDWVGAWREHRKTCPGGGALGAYLRALREGKSPHRAAVEAGYREYRPMPEDVKSRLREIGEERRRRRIAKGEAK